MKIAVVICTFRRSDSLVRALASIAEAEPPLSAAWQVLVVDNGDCRDTRRVVEDFRSRLPIDLLIAPEAGLARARNAAAQQVDCDYFLWTDDDVTVGRNWLRAYETAFARNPQAAFFGGPILPHLEGTPPSWLVDSLPRVYSAFAGCKMTGDVTRFDLHSRELPFGANFAVRGKEQRSLRYDVSLGRQPGPWLLGGEEVDLLRRICATGGTGAWVSDAEVTHWIDPKRQSIAYLRSYYEGQGFALARAKLAAQPRGAMLPRPVWRDLLRSELAYWIGWLTRRPKTQMRALKKASKLRGMLAAQRAFQRAGDFSLEAER
ncbi:MAG TPA: glycosyltransferase family 2 protein [Dongiaceae bacterium]|nr:glycosyltransferase family 2 protein [Dongiaceae bacterium]